MTPEEKSDLKQYFYSISLGPAWPIPKTHALHAVNYYSEKDLITNWAGYLHKNNDEYDIKMLKCTSSLSERVAYTIDHTFLGSTYQRALNNGLEDIRKGSLPHDKKNR